LRVKQQTPPTNGNLPNVEIVGGGTLITESLLPRAELTRNGCCSLLANEKEPGQQHASS